MPPRKPKSQKPAADRPRKPPVGATPSPAAIVGIGASAGGLEAVTALFDDLPSDTGLAFVFVQHLSPNRPSMLVELLARHTVMPVEEARHGTAVEPNRVYVIPPGTNLGILHGVLQVLPWSSDHHGRLLTVDHFLRALAQDQGTRAVGVILSGSASDGTLGMQAIKAEGGITLVQDETTAEHVGMPHSAIAAGVADLVLPPAGLARELARIAADAPRIAGAGPQGLGGALQKILFLLRSHTGHDLTGYKPNTIERRIGRRMLLHKLTDVGEYIRYLQQSPGEVQALFEDLLISVTAFFRDAEVFEILKEQVFPRLVEGRSAADRIRIWVPGCASGEEAYSLAIAMSEYIATRSVPSPSVQLFASDIDERAIRKARAGHYPESISADVSAERLQRFFVKTVNGYQVHRSVRELCVFAVQDLTRDPPFSRMDLISCRNLLIYFGADLQRRVLSTLFFALNPTGYLLLGTSEGIGKAADLFALVDKRLKIYRKKAAQQPPIRPPGTGAEPAAAGRAARPAALPLAPTRDVIRDAEEYLLAEFSPPALIVNEAMEVVGYSGRTGPYIEPAHGAASAKLLKVVRQELTAALHVAVRGALERQEQVRQEGVRYRTQDEDRYVDLVVTPLPAAPGHVLVVLDEARPVPPAAPQQPGGAEQRRMEALETELSATRQQLQSIISEQANTGEALQAAYEELLSGNEELQGTNEELESAKEELQSTNEELATVNEELVVRNRQLEHARDDLLNLLASAELPMVMLDAQLRVRHFTPQARPLLNLIDGDVGRELGHIRTNLDIDDLDRHLREVVATGTSRSLEVGDRAGRWYSLRMRPFKDKDGSTAGAVVVLVDLDEFAADHAQLHRLAAMVRESADAIALLDLDGHIVEWNRGAEELYGYPKVEALRLTWADLAPRPERPRTEEMLARLRRGEALRYVDSRRVTRDGRELEVRVTASPLLSPAGSPTAIAAIEQDITELKQNLARAQRLAAVVRDANDAITVRDFDGRILAWNQAAERMYGYKEKDVVGLHIDRLLPEAVREQEAGLVERLRRTEPVERLLTQRITRDGRTLPVELTASLLYGEDGLPLALSTTERLIGEAM